MQHSILVSLLCCVAAGSFAAQAAPPQLDLPPLPPLPGTEVVVQENTNALPPLPALPEGDQKAIPNAPVVQSFEAPPLQKLADPMKLAEPALPPLPEMPQDQEIAVQPKDATLPLLPAAAPLMAEKKKSEEESAPAKVVAVPVPAPTPTPVPAPQQQIVETKPLSPLPAIVEQRTETPTAPSATASTLAVKAAEQEELAKKPPMPLAPPPLPGQGDALKAIASAPQKIENPESSKAFGTLGAAERAKEMERMVERLESDAPRKEFKEMSSEEQQRALDSLLQSFGKEDGEEAEKTEEVKEGETAQQEIETPETEQPREVKETKETGEPLWKKRDTVMVPPHETLYGKNFRTQILPETISKKHYSKLNSHLPPSVHEEDLYAQLFHAAHNGNLPVLRALLEDYGLYLGRQNREGNTPLIASALAGQDKAAAILLARGADANTQNAMGMTALHIAASKGHYAIVSALLQAGANPNIEAKSGVTPLRMALAANHDAIAEVLLANRARRESRFISDMRLNAAATQPLDWSASAPSPAPFEEASMQKRQAAQNILMQAVPRTPEPVSAVAALQDMPMQVVGRSLPRIRKVQSVFAELKEINRYFPDLTFAERMQVNAKRKAYEEKYADVIATMTPEERQEVDSVRFIWEGWERASAAEASAYRQDISRSAAN